MLPNRKNRRNRKNPSSFRVGTTIALSALLAAPFLQAGTPAQAAPVGQDFVVTSADLAFILKQIKIAESHVANTNSSTGPCGALVGTGPNQLSSPLLSFGLRTVDGSCNNLTKDQEQFGAADQLFPRLAGKDFKAAEASPPGLFGPGSPSVPTTYADKTANNTVVDSQPRVVSNLIVDQTSSNPAAVSAAGFPVRTQGNEGVEPCTTDPGDGPDGIAGNADDIAGAPAGCVPSGQTLFIPNVTTDVGLSPPYNSWFTLFGQFFDHGIDQTVKGGGTVIVPLKADDPLIAGLDRIPGNADDQKPGDPRYVPPAQRFMVLTRASNQPGADGQLGTADDVQDAKNTDSPFVDQSQTYSSHPAHQVFLREYVNNSAGRPVATGRLLSGMARTAQTDGGMATWATVKRQARELLGLALSDRDVTDIPMILADAYGKFIPGPARGLPQYMTATGPVEGNVATPVAVPSNVLHIDTPFLTDIAHNADPSPVDADHNPGTPKVAPVPDANTTPSADFASQPAGTYDDEMLDAHFIAGDGRVNENIGLTTVHQVFHSEHDRLIGDVQNVLTDDTSASGVAALSEWKSALGADGWNGERLFQAARFITEMEYQHLVFEEFARKVQPAINPFQPFAFTQTELNPAISAEFAHAVYRFGHSMLTETIARKNEDGSDGSMSLLDGFLNPPAYTSKTAGGPSGVLTPEQAAGALVMGMSDQPGNELDEFVTDTLRNNLLGLPLDLAAINMTRARSEGVPSLNDLRRKLHTATNDGQLAPYKSWVDFGEHLKHPESLVNFVAAYGKHPSVVSATTLKDKRDAARAIVDPLPSDTAPADAAEFMNAVGTWTTVTSGLDDIDLWVGGLAETTVVFGGLLGSTFNYVFENQLTSLQNGDRLYYLARTPGMNLRAQLEGNSFAELVMRNTTAHTLKADSFATADCKFELSKLAGTPAGFAASGNRVTDDPTSECNEQLVLIRMPDGTIQYRARNTVDPAGINGQSVYNGTAGVDRIYGGNDSDTFWGNEGNDIIEGGDGADIALGGDGDDIITDLAGDDIPKGGPGNDAIDSGPGLDIVMSGPGKDFTNGGANINETFAGEDDDFVIAGDGEDAVFGDAGDDWMEGGNQPDLLQGDSGNLFFLDDSNKPGHDIQIGQGGDDDYDMEGGDDIGVQGPGIEKNAGGSGYDWSISSLPGLGGDAQPMDSDLDLPLLGTGILDAGVRDRYNELEALSGGALNDTLRGDDLVPSQVGGGGFLGCDALDAAGVGRIKGLNQIVTSFPTPVSTVGNATGRDCALSGNVWGEGNILLGGAGNDLIEGRLGDDIIDGDRYLNVRLSVRDSNGVEVRSARSMTELQADVFAGRINPGNIFAVREILTSTTPDIDTAVFSGNRADSTVTSVAGVTTVTGPDGTDTLRNIERLQFADDTVVTAPSAPTAVTATAGNAQATVTWTAPAATALPITGFVVERTNGTTVVLTNVAATARSFTATGLANGTAYTFRVRAVNAAGNGAFSAASNAVTPAAPTAPSAPTAVTATAGSTNAVVTWTAPASNGGSAITRYDVQVLTNATNAQVGDLRTAAATATQLTVIGLTNGTAYRFRVRAVNTIGASAFSANSNVVTPGRVPGAPASVTAISGAAGGALTAGITWTAPTNNGGSAITGYRLTSQRLNADGTDNGGPTVSNHPSTTRTSTFTAPAGVPANTRYRFTVQAVNALGIGVGTSAFSNVR
jgi:Ca2+-binding RTX toxin-like protein